MLMAATDVTAQTFQGVTEGDKAVTYQKSNNDPTVILYSIDKSKLAADGVIELPATVSYNGQDLPVALNCYGNPTPVSEVKKLIFHGKLFYQYDGKLFKVFPGLEEVSVDEDNTYFKSIDGVLYTKDLSTIVWVPAQWNPTGRTLYQPATTKIGNYAFYGVQFVGDEDAYQIPDQIETVNYYAFGNSALKGIKWTTNAKCTTIPSSCFFDCKNLVQVGLSDQVKIIASQAFANCSSLPAIDLKNVESLGPSTFWECTALQSVSSTENLEKIGVNTFKGCSTLPSIDLSQSKLTEIPEHAFTYCSKLKSVLLPEGLKSIGVFAFNQTSINQITLPESLETLSWFSLPYNLTSVHLGPNVKDLTGLSFYSRNYPIEVDEANPYFCVEDGSVWSKDKTTLVRFHDDGRKSYMVPAGVKRIETGAFYIHDNKLQHVTLPSSCESIGWDAFMGVRSITIPPTVTVFGGSKNPEYHTSRNIETSGGGLGWLGVFHYGDIYLMGTNPENITVPNSFYDSSSGMYKLYVTKTAYDKIKAMDPATDAGRGWQYILNHYSSLQYEIPVTLSSTGLSTMCRDFDVDLSQTPGLEAYIASSFQKTSSNEADIMNMSKVSTGTYVPSRYGTDNYDFCGIVLKGEAGASYTYRIGENDYKSGSQILLSDEQTNGNMLVGAPVHTWVTKTDGDKTNFILKNGKFRYVSQDGELAWNKCYLQIPTADYQAAGAKGIRFSFLDGGNVTGINGIGKDADHDNAPYYNLNGQRVEHPQRGIYIHNGKKVIIK